MKKNNAIYPFLLLLFISNLIYAQDVRNSISLREFLDATEERFQVTFTYADETIYGETISPIQLQTIDEVISYLQESTDLKFYKIGDSYFSISKSDNVESICGYVIDAENSEPISNVVIQNGSGYSLTNEVGFFEVSKLNPSDMISLQIMGYKTAHRKVSDFRSNLCITIRLQPINLTLQEVVISDYLVEGIYKQLDGSFIIRNDELGILPGLIEQDVLETVQALPGINSVKEKVADINVRSGTNDQNLVLWDGIRMYQYGHFFGLISAFNPYLTNEVKLTRNGSKASLTEGVSSTIEILSDDNIPNEISGGVGLNFINGDIFLKIPVSKKFAVQMSARRSITDLVTTPTYKKYFERAFGNTEVYQSTNSENSLFTNTDEEFNFLDINATLIYIPTEKDQLKLYATRYQNNLEFKENAILNDTTLSRESGLRQNNTALGLNYYRQWNDKISTSVLGFFTKYDLRAINHNISSDQRLIQENEVIDNGIKMSATLSIGKHNILEGGYHFTEVGIANLEDINNPTYYRYIKKVLRTHALFIESELNTQDNRTFFRLGVRGNYYQKFDLLSIEPRFSFSHFLFSNFSFEVLGEIKSQSITQVIDLQNDFLGVENRRWVLFNDKDIPLIKSKQVSAGLNFMKSGFLFSIDGFYKHVNGITSRSQGFQNQFQYALATGNYTSYGSDFLISQQINRLKLWVAYSISKNEYEFSAFSPSVFPSNYDIKHVLSLALSYQLGGLEVSTGVNWHSGIPYTIPVKDNEMVNGAINYDLPNAERIKNYFRWDMSAKYTWQLEDNRKLIFGASIWNISDYKNIINQYYTVDDSDQLVLVQQGSLGMTPNLSIRFHF